MTQVARPMIARHVSSTRRREIIGSFRVAQQHHLSAEREGPGDWPGIRYTRGRRATSVTALVVLAVAVPVIVAISRPGRHDDGDQGRDRHPAVWADGQDAAGHLVRVWPPGHADLEAARAEPLQSDPGRLADEGVGAHVDKGAAAAARAWPARHAMLRRAR